MLRGQPGLLAAGRRVAGLDLQAPAGEAKVAELVAADPGLEDLMQRLRDAQQEVIESQAISEREKDAGDAPAAEPSSDPHPGTRDESQPGTGASSTGVPGGREPSGGDDDD